MWIKSASDAAHPCIFQKNGYASGHVLRCGHRFPQLSAAANLSYVELLFNAVKKCLAVRPCEKDNPNAIQWGSLKDGKWIVKERSCRGFSTPLYETMGWNEELRYRMRGCFMGDSENKVMIFDLEEPEVVERVLVEDIPMEPNARGGDSKE